MKIVGIILLFVGVVATASAQAGRVPEVDANSAVNAVALVSGALLILKSRRKK